MLIRDYLLDVSHDYARCAEVWRKKGDDQWAIYLRDRHIETREKARALAKQAKAVKP